MKQVFPLYLFPLKGKTQEFSNDHIVGKLPEESRENARVQLIIIY
jgi:hypothetical protein